MLQKVRRKNMNLSLRSQIKWKGRLDSYNGCLNIYIFFKNSRIKCPSSSYQILITLTSKNIFIIIHFSFIDFFMHFMEQNNWQYKKHLIERPFPLKNVLCSLKTHNQFLVHKCFTIHSTYVISKVWDYLYV